MKNSTIFFGIFLASFFTAQEKEIINPKGNWYFGTELGTNKTDQTEVEIPTVVKLGIIAEYYFAKQFSVQGKIQYYKTAVNYNNEKDNTDSSISGGFSFFFFSDYETPKGNPYNSLNFEGNVISIPIYIKWEFRLIKNLKANYFLGPTFNIEMSSNYSVPGVENPDISMFNRNYLGYAT